MIPVSTCSRQAASSATHTAASATATVAPSVSPVRPTSALRRHLRRWRTFRSTELSRVGGDEEAECQRLAGAVEHRLELGLTEAHVARPEVAGDYAVPCGPEEGRSALDIDRPVEEALVLRLAQLTSHPLRLLLDP